MSPQCFAERLFYNKETRLFEEFIEKLADEAENDSTTERKASKQQQFKFLGSSVSDNSEKQSRIGYYVFVLDREQGLEFVREQRFDLFLRSHLHAEWKLSQTLSATQVRQFFGYRIHSYLCCLVSTLETISKDWLLPVTCIRTSESIIWQRYKIIAFLLTSPN